MGIFTLLHFREGLRRMLRGGGDRGARCGCERGVGGASEAQREDVLDAVRRLDQLHNHQLTDARCEIGGLLSTR